MQCEGVFATDRTGGDWATQRKLSTYRYEFKYLGVAKLEDPIYHWMNLTLTRY